MSQCLPAGSDAAPYFFASKIKESGKPTLTKIEETTQETSGKTSTTIQRLMSN